jgi:ubiquinone/menaquinone biosynthesis C-methylase UbiE
MKPAPTDPIRSPSLAPGRAETLQNPEQYFQQRLEQMIRPGDRILDAGCGAGKFFSLEFTREAGCRLFGVDIEEHLKINSRADFRARADLKNLPFLDGSKLPLA